MKATGIKLYRLMAGLFTKRKNYHDINHAISEGIKDAFKEMGYRFEEKE